MLEDTEQEGKNLLARAGVQGAGLCARLLMAHALGISKLDCLLQRDRKLSESEEKFFRELCRRCAQGEPLAYLVGRKEFYEHEFIVSPAVLIPRPETELAVDLALKFASEKKLVFADVGCGSGCIGLSLLAARPEWEGILLDRDIASLQIAGLNAARIAPRARLVRGDLFHPHFVADSLDLVVSNPPYIGLSDTGVMPQVVAYEPHLALFSGQDGLDHIDAVARLASCALRENGLLIMEHGAAQGGAVAGVLQSAGFAYIEDHRDLAGLSRCALARKP